mmetsp:Transcript_1753/g.3643  ORF Transcript_1753/g.3643 Transcript_1753/m.3643 type:complete len:212 (-) Transcript_1753:51-686(-)
MHSFIQVMRQHSLLDCIYISSFLPAFCLSDSFVPNSSGRRTDPSIDRFERVVIPQPTRPVHACMHACREQPRTVFPTRHLTRISHMYTHTPNLRVGKRDRPIDRETPSYPRSVLLHFTHARRQLYGKTGRSVRSNLTAYCKVLRSARLFSSLSESALAACPASTLVGSAVQNERIRSSDGYTDVGLQPSFPFFLLSRVPLSARIRPWCYGL